MSDAIDRLKLIQILNGLPMTQFEELVIALNPPAGILPSNLAAQGNRAPELLRWLEGPTGPGLPELQVLLKRLSQPAGMTWEPTHANPASLAQTLELDDLNQQLSLLSQQHQACAEEARLTGDPDRKIVLAEKVKRLLRQISDINNRLSAIQPRSKG